MEEMSGACGSIVVKALGYKPEGYWFETWWSEILNLPNLSRVYSASEYQKQKNHVSEE
jgi:hypothetical protein